MIRYPVVRRSITPFVKWAGGKTQLLPTLLSHVPANYGRYVEPFVGGGAFYFALQPQAAILGDLNGELIAAYRVIRESVEALIVALDQHQYDRDHYYAVRAQRPADLSPVQAAARFIFLNKTGYNGLYRVNRRGEFNVPFGRYRTPPRLCDPENLRAESRLLATADLIVAPFWETANQAKPGDFVYFDPPYVPLSSSANFTRYTSHGFTLRDQERLADLFRSLDERGCFVLLSNSATPLTRSLYEGFAIEEVAVNRLINSRSDGRVGITELIVRNF